MAKKKKEPQLIKDFHRTRKLCWILLVFLIVFMVVTGVWGLLPGVIGLAAGLFLSRAILFAFFQNKLD